MKRAEIFNAGIALPWAVQIIDGPLTERYLRIADREDDRYLESTEYFPSHAEALDCAIEEVGLARRSRP